MSSFLCWIVIVIFGLLLTGSVIGPLSFSRRNVENIPALYLSIISDIVILFPLQSLYGAEIASKIVIIGLIVIALLGLLHMLVNKRNRTNSCIIFLISSGLLTAFLLNTYPELYNNDTLLWMPTGNNPYILLLTICLILLIISFIFFYSTIRESRKQNSYISDRNELAELLQKNIECFSKGDSFSKQITSTVLIDINSQINSLNSSISEIEKKLNAVINNGYSIEATKMGPMIYNMTETINSLKNIVVGDDKDDSVSKITLLKEINHTLATPISQIETNCELLKKHGKDATEKVTKIKVYLAFCKSILQAYKELYSQPVPSEEINLETEIRNAFEMFCESRNKGNLKLDIAVDNDTSLPKNKLIALLMPLIQNAVDASPENENVSIRQSKKDNSCMYEITNITSTEVSETDLLTEGYSSKNNHIGTGLSVSRHFLKQLKSPGLYPKVNGNHVSITFTIPIKSD